MPEPALHQMRRHVGLEGVHAEAVAQPFRHRGRAADLGGSHDFLDAPPRGRPAPTPDSAVGRIWIALASPQMKDMIEFGDHAAGQWHLTDDPSPAALQGRDVDDAALQVDRRRGEGQDFGNPAAAQTQHKAKELYVEGRAARCPDETPTLSSVEIFPATGWAEKASAFVKVLAHGKLD